MQNKISHKDIIVAPFVGAWIEMYKTELTEEELQSLRSSERGLKLHVL